METRQYLRRTREQVPPVKASNIDNRTNLTTIKLLKVICLKNIVPKLLTSNSYFTIRLSISFWKGRHPGTFIQLKKI